MEFQGVSRKPIVVALVGLSLIAAVVLGWRLGGRELYVDWRESRELAVLAQDEKTAPMATAVITARQQVDAEPKKIEARIELGNAWKQLFDVTADPRHIQAAIGVYEQVLEIREGALNSVVHGNLAYAYKLNKDYAAAEKALREALVRNPGDPQLYVSLIELLRYNLNSSPEAIIDVYRDGLDRLVDNAPLVQSLADYLRDIGRYKDALAYYRLLATRYPQYEEQVKDMEARIQAETP